MLDDHDFLLKKKSNALGSIIFMEIGLIDALTGAFLPLFYSTSNISDNFYTGGQ